MPKTTIDTIIHELKDKLSKTDSLEDISSLESEYIGKKSKLTELSQGITTLKPEDKKAFGIKLNKVKEESIALIEDKKKKLKQLEYDKENSKWSDVTLFKREVNSTIHPITQAIWEIEDIFTRMGFDIAYPYEIDSQDNNFTYVNMPPNHPARSSWDSFFTKEGFVPIVHTSSMQNRIYKRNKLPIYTLIPGRCFRNEATDPRHEHTFYQFEGIVVDKEIKFSDMLGTLKAFFSAYFEKEVEVMLTPDMFPFVEPGGMIQVKWEGQSDAILKITKGTGWLEILGCGMIHPNVLKEGGIDPEVYSGFAWGGGIERLIMLKHSIEDLRLFESGDLKFLKQF